VFFSQNIIGTRKKIKDNKNIKKNKIFLFLQKKMDRGIKSDLSE